MFKALILWLVGQLGLEPTITTQVVTVIRLSPEVYAKLESQLPKVGKPTNGEEACYLAGVQHALTLLRSGFVTKETQ